MDRICSVIYENNTPQLQIIKSHSQCSTNSPRQLSRRIESRQEQQYKNTQEVALQKYDYNMYSKTTRSKRETGTEQAGEQNSKEERTTARRQ